MKLSKIKFGGKHGTTEWTVGKLLTLILLVLVLALVIYGFTSGAINPLVAKIKGIFDSILILFGKGSLSGGGSDLGSSPIKIVGCDENKYPTIDDWKIDGNQVIASDGRCLDIRESINQPGASVIVYDCDKNKANQKWVTTEGQFKSFLPYEVCLAVLKTQSKTDYKDGDPIIIYPCDPNQPNKDQQWKVPAFWNKLKSTELGYCIGTEGGASTPGTQAVIWPCQDKMDQYWDFKGNQIKNLYDPKSDFYGKCLGTEGDKSNPGTRVVVTSCTDDSSKTWNSNVQKGYNTVLSGFSSDLCLAQDLSNGGNPESAIVYGCNSGKDQNWYLSTDGKGQIKNGKGLCLSVDGGN